MQDRELTIITTGLTTAKARQESAQREWQAAMEAGDYAKAAVAQTEGQTAAADILHISAKTGAGVPELLDAVLAAGKTRLRQILMTALAMILGMIPMALGAGEAGEQNAPLGRAVIGGLIAATIATLVIVPIFYTLLRRAAP